MLIADRRYQIENEIYDAIMYHGESAPRLFVTDTQGSGKTTCAMQAAGKAVKDMERTFTVLNAGDDSEILPLIAIHFATRELAIEKIKEFRKMYPDVPAKLILGMTKCDEFGEPLCKKPELVEAATLKHVGAKESICVTCAHRSSCGYFKQLDPISSGEFRYGVLFMMHSHVLNSPLEGLAKRVMARIIDEDFTSEMVTVSRSKKSSETSAYNRSMIIDHADKLHPMGDLLRIIFRASQDKRNPKEELFEYAAQHNIVLAKSYLRDLAKTYKEKFDPERLDTSGMTDDQIAQAISDVDYSPLPATILRRYADEMNFDRKTPHIVGVNGKAVTVRYTRDDRIRRSCPIVFLDGTTQPEIAKYLWGDGARFSGHDFQRNMHHVLVMHKGVTMGNLLGRIGESQAGKKRKRNKALEEIRGMLDGPLANYGRGLIVTYKKLAELALEQFSDRYDVDFAYFGNIRGTNKFQECDYVVLYGRPGTPWEETENQAIALTQSMSDHDIAYDVQWLETLIDHEIVDGIGHDRITTTVKLPDNEVVRQFRYKQINAELSQVSERLRSILHEGPKPKMLFHITKEYVPDTPVNEVVQFSQWLKRGHESINEIIRQSDGVLVLDFADIANRVFRFSSKSAARDEFRRAKIYNYSQYNRVGWAQYPQLLTLKIKGRKGRPSKVMSWRNYDVTMEKLFQYVGGEFTVLTNGGDPYTPETHLDGVAAERKAELGDYLVDRSTVPDKYANMSVREIMESILREEGKMR